MEKLYYNGKILTMEKDIYTTAVLVEDGIISSCGMYEKLCVSHPNAERIDLKGCAMMPAFIDSHSHFASCAIASLYPSLEDCKNFNDIQNIIKQHSQNKKEGEWLIFRDYEPSKLSEKTQPNKNILDEVSPNNPVVIQHKSGHGGIFNSLAIKMLNISNIPVEKGIEIKDGNLTGYVYESAYMDLAINSIPMPSADELLEAFKNAQDMYFSYGITTIQDGLILKETIPVYKNLIKSGILKADVVGFYDLKDNEKIKSEFSEHIKTYKNNFKIGGIKIFIDGSPQLKTAYMSRAYTGNNNRGICFLTQQQIESVINTALENEMQVICHSNGDAACDMFIKAVGAVSYKNKNVYKLRPVIIHGQFINPADLNEAKNNNIMVSFFISNLFYYGDIHVENLGINRASQMNPLNSALHSVNFTLHQDSPVCKPNMLESVYCAVSRKTSSGRILGQNQKIPVINALKSITINAAYQYFEEKTKGSIAKNKLADFVILDKNPLEVSVEEIRNIKVVETIKNGNTVWKA